MREWSTDEFVRKLHLILDNDDCKVVWFFGAGCSVSSEIPGAGALVERWLPRLKHLKTGFELDWQTWAVSTYGFDPANPALIYGEIISELFPVLEERQKEIEQLAAEKDPRIGYALFAVLASHEKYGPRSNVVLTTNFDDLVADAFYLMTRKKPLVIAHDSLAEFAQQRRNRPLVIKLHGDAHLAPRNTSEETAALNPKLAEHIISLFGECALIFLGYGGNDESIFQLLSETPSSSFPKGIYWVGAGIPDGPVGRWLEERNNLRHDVFSIRNQDFDDFFLQVKYELGLQLPDASRIIKMFETLEAQMATDERAPSEISSPEKRERAGRARRTFDALSLANRAREIAHIDVEKADDLYIAALEADPAEPNVLGGYALFLMQERKRFDQAQAMFERAIEADQNNVTNLGNYALFLAQEMKMFDLSTAMYERAIGTDPNNAVILGNFANFLAYDAKDFVRARAMYERSIETDPNSATNLGNFANFLARDAKEFIRAEAMFERAINVDPNNATNISNYAVFLAQTIKDSFRAQGMFLRAMVADPGHSTNLGSYANFLATDLRDFAQANAMYERALEVDPNNVINLGNYANFLLRDAKDFDRAKMMYARALEVDPQNAVNIGNYANFLVMYERDVSAAKSLYEKSIALDPTNSNNLANMAQILFAQADGYGDCKRPIEISEQILTSGNTQANVRLEVCFYLIVHKPDTEMTLGPRMYEWITEGVRSKGWSFDLNLDWAERNGDVRVHFLRLLADVISEKRALADLQNESEWKSWGTT